MNIRDVESSFMKAKQQVESRIQEKNMEFYQPLYDVQLALLWKSFPPEIKEQLKAMNPQAYKDVVKNIGE